MVIYHATMLALSSSGVKIIWLSSWWLWGTDGGRILSARISPPFDTALSSLVNFVRLVKK
jgi:hypothetical protein